MRFSHCNSMVKNTILMTENIIFINIIINNSMEKSFIDRIKLIMEKEKENPNSFANAIGINSASIYHLLNGKTKPSINTIEKILKAYPSYNRDWLITGLGVVKVESIVKTETEDLNGEMFELLKRELSFKDKVINRLESELDKVWQVALSKGGNPNFLKASDVAGIPLYLLKRAGYSVANAQC